MDTVKTITVNIVVATVLALILIAGNTLYRQHTQFRRGEQAMAQGDIIAAIAAFEASIHMYFPGSPLIEQGAERLWGIGETMERQGDVDRALIAYRSLRSSFYAVRGPFQPGAAWIARCDARIADLVRIQLEKTQNRQPH